MTLTRILSEYHAAGAATGAFMIRKGPFKYIHYVGMSPQLLDLDADPQETGAGDREDPGNRRIRLCGFRLQSTRD